MLGRPSDDIRTAWDSDTSTEYPDPSTERSGEGPLRGRYPAPVHELVSIFSFALDSSQVRTATLAGSVIPVILGLLLFRIVASAFARAFILVIALVLGGLIYLQRQEISTCIDDAKAGLVETDPATKPKIECEIFGYKLRFQP